MNTSRPGSTWRLQVRGKMGFAQALALVPYLHELGIRVLYLSPAAVARGGSLHGYDVSDPTRLDPSLGDPADFDHLVDELRKRGMSILLDIVPNHMVADGSNPWWRDVLRHGRSSEYAEFFDVRWGADPEGRLVLPILGRHYGDVLESAELVPDIDRGELVMRYFDHVVPLDPRTWPLAFDLGASTAITAALRELRALCEDLPDARRSDPPARRHRAMAFPRMTAILTDLHASGRIRPFLDQMLGRLGGRSGDSSSFDALHALLELQPWRLAYWRSGLGELNYHRFFDISELVAVRGERREVFSATHSLIRALAASGSIMGVRVDHIDGLADPRAYLDRLRSSGVRYVIVEKVLADGEDLRPDWPVDGTTGYDFLAAVTRVFVDPDGFGTLERDFVGDGPGFRDVVHDCKLQVLDESFTPGVERLARDLRELTRFDRHARDVSLPELDRVLREITAVLPVYRTYVGAGALGPEDRKILDQAVAAAKSRLGVEDRVALEFVHRLLCLACDQGGSPIAAAITDAVSRWQQLTGPAMAKGQEDTALYRFVPLLALNDVGLVPEMPPDPVSAFHRFNCDRQARRPGTLNTTSTHDTKRGEDARARLAVLSELAERWIPLAARCRHQLDAAVPVPPADRAELDVMLQSLVAVWPTDGRIDSHLRERLAQYMIKAVREAKRRTGWLRQDEAYERAVLKRLDVLLDASEHLPWGKDLARLAHEASFYGAVNSLAQLVLKMASPGVPDMYQGTEWWDFTLVDPDNRQPFSLDARHEALKNLVKAEDPTALAPELLRDFTDGRIKLWVSWRCLRLRGLLPGLFAFGGYYPVAVHGRSSRHVCAFARHHREAWVLAVVPRLTARLVSPGTWPIGPGPWQDTELVCPEEAPRRWVDAISRRPISSRSGVLRVQDVFSVLPIALLKSE